MTSSETPSLQPPSEEASSAHTLVQNNVRGNIDIAWAHCTKSHDGKSLVCIYYHKDFGGGGIHRVKQHLDEIVENIEICKLVPAEIRFQMKQHFNERSKKRKISNVAESESFTTEGGGELQVQTNPQIGASKKNNAHIGTYFLPITTLVAQPTLKSVTQSKEVVEKCDFSIASGILMHLFHSMLQICHFQPAIDALCCMGTGYKVPTIHALRGTIFIKSVDASGASKTANTLSKLFKEVMLYADMKNVVQIVTNNASNYVNVGKLLEKEFPKLYWYSCATLCINLMLQDMGKLEEVKPLVRALHIIDSEAKLAMGYLYQTMYKAIEGIEKRFRINKLKVYPYLKILDNRWDAQLHKNLHVVGYWLNLSYRFNQEYEKDKSTTQGLLDVIEKYSYDSKDLRTKLTIEMSSFKNCEGSFGRTTAIENRDKVFPDQLNLDEVDVESDEQLNYRENNQSNDIIDGEDVANVVDFATDGFDIEEGDPTIEMILPLWN
ncbi:hypothetical protein KIW84_052149 [Lathyrus oleraceus]|uniref:DUF659 domain-containing protein n=1 Tax=Pisum sativum TaxID=3888 RepID=A0A9D4WLY0_PEA|nr:hypothetical protein KIW84_052149 [Pisum sativum]